MKTYDRRSLLKRGAAAAVALGLAGPLARVLPAPVAEAWPVPVGTIMRVPEIDAGLPLVMKADVGWLLCDGQSFSVAEYPGLAATLRAYGTPSRRWIFGSRRGRPCVPDMRGRLR